MRKPRRMPQTKLEQSRFVQVSQHTSPLELMLNFEEPLSLLDADRLARRILESIEIKPCRIEAPHPVASVSLRSQKAKVSIPVRLEEA